MCLPTRSTARIAGQPMALRILRQLTTALAGPTGPCTNKPVLKILRIEGGIFPLLLLLLCFQDASQFFLKD
jgi:hypothetical protein